MNGSIPLSLGMTCNWVAERRVITHVPSYYGQLVFDCIDQIRTVGVAYCFTTEQADAIQQRINRQTIREWNGVGYTIRRP